MKYLQVKLPNDVHKKFKKFCFDLETDMSSVIRQYIEMMIKGE